MTNPEHTEHAEITDDVSTEDAHAAWAGAAREMLIGTARRYHHVISTKDLAAGVQERTGITANQRVHYWIGDVLGLVAQECSTRGEPNLSALCVNAEGSVGDGYAGTVAGGDPDDPDGHAAIARLACYSHFEATGLPADGGVAVLTPKLSASRSRVRKAALAARPLDTCPRCFMVLPTNGTCDSCD